MEAAPDWNISRNRYWASPLPIWKCGSCNEREFLGSLEDIKKRTTRGNHFLAMRHGECIHNVRNILSCDPDAPHHLTDKGREEARITGEKLKGRRIDLIISSPFQRTRETAQIVADSIGYPKEKIAIDPRIQEINAGVFDGKSIEEYHAYFD